jgi:hypothetical protein
MRRGGREDDAPWQVGANQGDLLRDEAAEGEAEQIHPFDAYGVNEGDRIVGHRFDGVRRGTGGGSDADVVKRNDASSLCQCVDQGGISVVEVSPEVLEQDEGDLALAEVAVRVLDSVVGGDSLARRVGVPLDASGVVAGSSVGAIRTPLITVHVNSRAVSASLEWFRFAGSPAARGLRDACGRSRPSSRRGLVRR